MSPLTDWIAEYRNLRRDPKGEIAQEDDYLLQATMLALQGLDAAITENRGTSEAEEPDLDAYARNPITGY
jgi:hypothetical protein